MPLSGNSIRTCPSGHHYYKSSSCPVCPQCEKGRVPEEAFLSLLSAPARRALENAGITTLPQLSRHTEKDLLALHGFGPASIPKLRHALKEVGLDFS
jgi:predicted RecB family nuclease